MKTKQAFRKLFVALVTAFFIVGLLPVSAFAESKKPVPGKVTLSKVSATAYNKIKISWKKTSNATNYVVYYKKAGAAKWTKLKTVDSKKTSYTHASSKKNPIIVGQKYSYTVRAYNSKSKKYGKYDTTGLTARTLPAKVKLNKAELNSKKTAVTVSWNKASGCNYYVIYRKTGSSSWKKLASVKSNVFKYTDKNPVKGAKNTYTVKSYYSKTKVYGKYDKTGVSVSVPSAAPNKTGIAQAYKKVLKAVAAGKSGYGFPEISEGARDLKYFLYDMNKDGIKELIVSSECTAQQTLLLRLCHVYTCKKTATGYTAKRISGYFMEPRIPASGAGLFENLFSRAQFTYSIYRVTIRNNKLVRTSKPLYEYHLGEAALEAIFDRNPTPTWIAISDYSGLNKL